MAGPSKTGAALDRLAALMPNGELRLATEPAWEFLGAVADLVVTVQAERYAARELLRPFAEKGRDLRPKAAAFRVLGGQFGDLPLEAWLKAADLLYPEEKKP